MIRDFSGAKKEELYRALDMIDDQDGESFRVWSGRRGYEFGEWADRLGIHDYMRRAEVFQDRIRMINSSTRTQIEANFEGVENIDARGANDFREYAEIVKSQIEAVRIMMQFMQSAGRTGTGIEVLLRGLTLQSKRSYAEQLEDGQKVLLSYLSVRGITDPAEQQEIRDLIMEEQPYMLASLYISDYYSSENAIVIYNSIMDYYDKYKKKITLMSYLEESGIIDSAEQQKIYNLILYQQPNMLDNLYTADYHESEDSEDTSAIYDSIMDYYNKHKMDITIQDVEGLALGGVLLQQIQKATFVECWNYLFSMGLNEDQVIAVIANIHAEGELSPTNRQNTRENKNIEDSDYTYLTGDNVGYGILQWTYFARKEGLLNMANEMGKEVSDLDVQLEYFRYEMEESYDFRKIWPAFLAEQDRYKAIEYFYCNIEKPKSSVNKNSKEYKNAISKRTGYADDISRWLETIFDS